MNHRTPSRAARASSVIAGLALAAAPLALAVPATAAVSATAPVVISEVYGGGGNPNAVLSRDFIELRNTSADDVDLTGWAVQVAFAKGNGWQVTPLSGTIAAGDTLLIGMATGADTTLPGFTPDLEGTTDVIPFKAKVALTGTTTALVCASDCAILESVVDLVGYGEDASAWAGSAPAIGGNNLKSIARDEAGTNTADNAADFSRQKPTPQAASGGTGPEPGQDPVPLSFLSTNDFHGRIDTNTVSWAGTIEEQRTALAAAGRESLLIGAGDLIGASLFASAVQADQPTIDVLNAVGLDASATGNHEYDQGFDDLVNRVVNGGTNATWDYLAANVYDATGAAALPEYSLQEVGGVAVGVIGVVTEETPTLVSPDGVAGLTFGDPVEAINRVAAQLTDGDASNGEADVIVATSHEGAPTGTPGGGTLENQLAASQVFADIVNNASPAVDVLIQGHTHQEYAWLAPVPGTDAVRPVIQTGQYGTNIGRVDITYDPATDAVTVDDVRNVPRTSTDPATLIATYPSVAEVNEIVTAALGYAAEVGETPVATLTADITTAFSGGSYVDGEWVATTRDDRGSESTLGDLVADALVATLSSADRGGATIGVVNPGGLRAELTYASSTAGGDSDGVITYAEANAVLPFNNNLWTTSLTGAQFLELLEQQWQTDATGAVPSRAYLQLGLSSNVTYTFEADPDGDGVTTGDLDDQGRHITSVTVDGAPLDPAATYRVGSFSFLLQGGDNFRVLAAGTETRDSGLLDRDAWIDYLRAASPLSPDFARQATQAPALGTVTAGDEVSVAVGGLNLTSLGSPENTSATVSLAGQELGTFEVTGGVANVTVTIPADAAAGASALTLVAAPSGTTVTLPLTIEEGTPTFEVTTSTGLFVFPTEIRRNWWFPVISTVVVSTSDGSRATGTVEIRDGEDVIASTRVRYGIAVAVFWPRSFERGEHELTATFIPASSEVEGSTSDPVSLRVR